MSNFAIAPAIADYGRVAGGKGPTLETAMRIFSEHHLRDSEAFLRSANAALIKGLPKFRVYQRLTVADRSRAYFLWEAPSEHGLREFIEREFLLAEFNFFGLWIIPAIEFPPAITSVFPFSVIQPGGGVIVQGEHFQGNPGQLLLLLSASGTQLALGNLQWGDTFAAGIIPMITGVPDQPALLQVVTQDGKASNQWPVQFTATRAVVRLPGTALTPVACGSGGDDFCYIGSDTDPFTVAGGHAMSVGFYSASGTDVYNCSLANGWVFDHYQWGTEDGIQGGPFGQAPDPIGQAEFTLAISWFFDVFGSSSYDIALFVVGPAGVPFN